MKRRFLALGLTAIMAASVMAGCGSDSQESSASSGTAASGNSNETSVSASADSSAGTQSADGDIYSASVKIGLSQMSLTTEYQANLTKAIQAEVEANYPNVELIVTDADADAATQVTQVENLISQGCDAILMVPYDRNGCIPAVEAAADAGIPLIELCQETDSEDRTSFVGSLHYESGEITMTAIAEAIGGSGKVVYLEGPIGQDSALARTEAANDVLAESYPDIEMVAERVCDWDRAAAMTAVENLIQSGMEFDAIYAESDSMALGAMEALSGTEYEDTVIVGGIDLIEDAYYSISEGGMYCTAFQNFPQQAVVGMEVAVRAALGETIDPEYVIPFELITADNIDEYAYVFES